MFKTHELNIHLESIPFGNLRLRDRTVPIVIKNSVQKYLLGSSSEYSPDVVRLLRGGVDKRETTIEAAVRELREETGLEVGYVYYLNTVRDGYKASDDMNSISDRVVVADSDSFSWRDFGKVYGYVHELALNEVLKMTS